MKPNRKFDPSPPFKDAAFAKTKMAARGALRFAYEAAGRVGLMSAGRVTVLCYHSVREDGLFRISTQSQVFESHLAWLAENCDVISFAQIKTLMRGAARRPAVAITFDDGYMDNVEHALPLLVKYVLPATFFIATGLLQKDASTRERMARQLRVEVDDLAPMDVSALKELRAAGMSIGAHTHTHPRLAKLSIPEVEEEFSSSKRILEDCLGIPVNTMAYPYGIPGLHFDKNACRAAASVGYVMAGTTQSRAVRRGEQAFMIPRFVVKNDSLQDVRCMVLGAFDAFGWSHEARFRLGLYKSS